nr:LysE family transporter [Uliginosibacterium sp. TH139]
MAAAIGMYVLVCALGLSLVLLALPGLSRILSVVGVLYLGWLGIQQVARMKAESRNPGFSGC